MLLFALASVLGCERVPPTPRVVGTPTPLDPATTGTIAGRVLFEGVPPPPRTIAMESDPTCAAAHPGGLVVRDVEGADGGLADAFVYVASGLEDRVFAPPTAPVVIDQRGCRYVPRVAAAQVGQPIVFKSSDDTLHNVHGEPRANARWNFGLPGPSTERTMVLDAPEVMATVRCDVHPWMRLELSVVPHPYFVVTGADGTFRLPNVPAGAYTLAALHPTLGRRELAVTVAAGATAMATIRFASP
ncbi:MAG: hypothetical protein IT293_07545 [Deltaproteobacteria bacterium]|nr:hypothetical protein [Deltaproteobacteria bacterium]